MGRSTRGKTAANRLRRTDTFVLLDRPSRLRSLPPLYVDLGYGADPSTTIETYRRLRPFADGWRVTGVEIDRERVLAMNVYERAIDRDAPSRRSSDRPAHRLVLSPNLRRPWTPLELRTVLSKNFIHHAGPTSRLDRLFTERELAWHRTAGQPIGKGPAFERAALALVDAGYDVDQRRSLLRRGLLILRSVG